LEDHALPLTQRPEELADFLRRCMRDLGLKRGWLTYPGREAYSLGEGITAVPAEQALSRPENVAGH
jgi:hypothetical protein